MVDFQYVIDSSIIMRRSKYQVYELDSFPKHWENFENRIKDGIFVSIPSVKKEINQKNVAALQWTKNNDILFNEDMSDPKVINELRLLSAKFPKWYNKGINSHTVWADPELIAFAKAHDIIIVTCEKFTHDKEEQNYSIPTICSKLGAYCHIRHEYSLDVDSSTPFQCIDFLELIKREKLFE